MLLPVFPRGHPHLLFKDLHKMLHILISDLGGDLIDAPVVVQKGLLGMLDAESGKIFGIAEEALGFLGLSFRTKSVRVSPVSSLNRRER